MNKENLLKLATYLLSGDLKADFDMSIYGRTTLFGIGHTECGTVGCAVGHGPYADVPKDRNETWGQYAERVFIPEEHHFDVFTFLFGAVWESVDNTATGAAKRILYYLRFGCPDNTWDQIQGKAPLCYEDETL